MGANRILSAKKHSAKLSKYSALLYASSAHISFPPPSFRDSCYRHKAGFLSRLEPLGCGRLLFIGCSVICIYYLCVIGDEVCYFFWNEETNHGDKFSCPMLLVLSMIDSLGVDGCSLLDVAQYILAVYAQKKIKVYFFFWSQKEKQIPFSRSIAWHH